MTTVVPIGLEAKVDGVVEQAPWYYVNAGDPEYGFRFYLRIRHVDIPYAAPREFRQDFLNRIGHLVEVRYAGGGVLPIFRGDRVRVGIREPLKGGIDATNTPRMIALLDEANNVRAWYEQPDLLKEDA